MTPLVNWLLDADMFEEYRTELIAAIQAEGQSYKLISAPKAGYSWDDEGCSYRHVFPKDACVVFHGDIELSLRIYHDGRWTPGAYCDVDNFRCSRYFSEFGEFLLNNDYLFLPFAELDRRREFLFRALGKDGTIFVRPDSPLKLFTGQVVTNDSFSQDLEFMAFYEFPGHELVVISSPKTVAKEWRFIIVNHQVIAGTQYAEHGRLVSRPGYDPSSYELAKRLASHSFEPDPVWVMDICKTAKSTYHLLEIGAFSFASLYSCDKVAVVRAVSQSAINDHQKRTS